MIPISWLMFASTDLSFLFEYMQRLVGVTGEMVFESDYMKYIEDYGALLLTGFIFSIIPVHDTFDKIKRKFPVYVVLLLVFGYSVYCMYKGLNDPFMYFNF